VTKHVENQHGLMAGLSAEASDQLDKLLRQWLAAFAGGERS